MDRVTNPGGFGHQMEDNNGGKSGLLRYYQHADYATRMRVRFVFWLSLFLIAGILLTLSFTLYIDLNTPPYALNYRIVFVEIALLFFILIGMVLLYLGFFKWISHLLQIVVMLGLWYIIFSEDAGLLVRLDTIILIVASLSMLPLLVQKNRYLFLVYPGLNLGVLFVFILLLYSRQELTWEMTMDFLVVTSLAIIFTGIIGYHTYRINHVSLHRAETTIREKEVAEEALAQSEKLYRTLMENLNEVVMMVDHDDRIRFVNRKFTEKLGYQPEEVLGEIGYQLLLDPADYAVIKQANETRKANISSQYELTFKAKDGEPIDFLISGAPLIDADGRNIGSIGTMTDITERNKVVKELERYRQNLEALVRERTEELTTTNEELKAVNDELFKQREALQQTLNELHATQHQLIQSEKMASLGILAAGVAHEINNPLNFIHGGISVIEAYFEEHLREHRNRVDPLIRGIHEGVARASRIVTSLNHFSRTNDAIQEECNIHEILEHCLTMLHSRLQYRIHVEKHLYRGDLFIRGNEGKLHQAFLNILANADQSMEREGILTIRTWMEDRMAIVSITDTGSGISHEDLPNIFNPFFTTKDPGQGTGLGLAITFSIIQEHGGTIEYQSTHGSGTTAVIRLPFSGKYDG